VSRTRREERAALARAERAEHPEVAIAALGLEWAGMDPDNASAHLRRCEWADAQGFTEDDAD
jgi:hypothetical protein